MRRLALLLAVAAALASGAALGQANDEALQRAFTEGMQQVQAGNLAQAEAIFRDMLKRTGSPRVKLELTRTLYLQGKFDEAKTLFHEVSVESDVSVVVE
ncbi:MAG: hypothetical protein E6H39_06410 [Betaproteobacteria bacterium]|nr:MAG: hypothetical protein E6H39_06410 [Betaproteobacteria bacterium]